MIEGQILFVDGQQEALLLMAIASFDVLVTDMNMQGMDAMELLLTKG